VASSNMRLRRPLRPPAEQALALADEDSAALWRGRCQLALATLKSAEQIESVFRSGAGFGWHEHDDGVRSGVERFFRPGYNANRSAPGSQLSTCCGETARRGRGRRRRLRARSSTRLMATGVSEFDLRWFRLPRLSRSTSPARRPKPPGSRGASGSTWLPRLASRAPATTSSPCSTACTTWATRSAQPATFEAR